MELSAYPRRSLWMVLVAGLLILAVGGAQAAVAMGSEHGRTSGLYWVVALFYALAVTMHVAMTSAFRAVEEGSSAGAT
jgi:hypothetical protein